jgi:NAD-dependent SIR2 family protein deacetylase
MTKNEIEIVLEKITNSDAILISIGEELENISGLKALRDNEVFWKEYPAIEKQGVSFNELENPLFFIKNPELSWIFYGDRYKKYNQLKYNKIYKDIIKMVKNKENNYFIYTSSIGGYHQKLGFDNKKICETRGSILKLQCLENCTTKTYRIENYENILRKKEIPRCECGSILRPNIEMNNDITWNDKEMCEKDKLYEEWIDKNKDNKVLIIEIGADLESNNIQLENDNLINNLKDVFLIRINSSNNDVLKNGIGLKISELENLSKLF